MLTRTAQVRLEDRIGVVAPPSVRTGKWRVPRVTVRDVEALLQAGVLPEDASTELLGGVIVKKDRADSGEDPEVIGKKHALCVERLSNLRMHINGNNRHVRSQQPFFCAEDHLPEPDFAVVRGRLEDYADRYPTAADAWCVLEVADSSYGRDVGEKLVRYAQAGVGQYIVLHLSAGAAEVYAEPDVAAGTYASRRVVTRSERLPIRVGVEEFFDVALADVLPPA